MGYQIKSCCTLIASSAVLALGMATPISAAESFIGETLRVKLIGGAQYEPLYALISDWEKQTGAKVQVLSRKNHFELDREMKQDIAAGNINYCVTSNHTSFAPQYGDIFADLTPLLSSETLSGFVPLTLQHGMVNGALVQLPRHSDVSNLFYKKSLFESAENKTKFKAKFGYELSPPDTWAQVKDQAIFFADPPNFYGTQYVGKDEAITGRFYEMLVAEGGALFDDKWNPTFNSEAGQRALQWFVDLYEAKAVPAGVPNYLWDDTGMGFASGTVALNLDWAGWAGFFNSESSKVTGDVGLVRAPKGSSGKRTGWSGSHTFSITEACDNKAAAASFITFLTGYDAQMLEADTGLLPTRTKVWSDIVEKKKAAGDMFMVHVFETYKESMANDAFTPPLIEEWVEVSNALWPQLQAAVVGEKSVKEALDDAAEDTREVLEDSGRL
ncbi:ABC transporter substrate-binding protein [Enterovibrio norvegicus]|uniref:ABC transporter substrate-binding protein n=1 Tax=Enterovibrio norvegicus TaxID=188144 RepID=UPI0013D0EE36|nr:sugar ABC transporter substrate-binding protein [Enterovibrio norvegicus]